MAIRPRFHVYVVSVYSVSSHDGGNGGEGENELRLRYWIITHFWETTHLPLPKANILPQVRSRGSRRVGGQFPRNVLLKVSKSWVYVFLTSLHR